MRYLRDLGEDAHLFLFADELAHFLPENDTWNYDRWKPFIHRLDFRNSQYDLVLKIGRSIGRHFKGFDAFIGSGLAPALLAKAGIRLDIYYPYATEVEYVGAHWLLSLIRKGSLKRRLFYSYVQKRQIEALLKCRVCINTSMDSYTENIFRSFIGTSTIKMTIPMVYNRDDTQPENFVARMLAPTFSAHSFTLVSHARHFWAPGTLELYPTELKENFNKHNDWLIQGFAAFVERNPEHHPLLVLFDYGPDVGASKDLVRSLGIGRNILWLPKLPRKEIMLLLSISDIGVGEFHAAGLWGGTGWETLAARKPLLQSVNYSPRHFRGLFDCDPPPVLDVKSPADIEKHLVDFVQNREKYKEIGEQSRRWFDENNGIRLASRYLDLLKITN